MNYLEQRMNDAKVNYMKAAPETFLALAQFSEKVFGVGLDKKLMELVRVRCAQINRCAYNIEMHTQAARAIGETEERLYMLAAWRDSNHFTNSERAALAWTEALTTLNDHAAVASALPELQAQFSDEEIMNITMVLGAVNIWNRLNIGFHLTPSAQDANTA